MDDDPLSFEAHSRRQKDAGVVRCAKCGEWIVATTSRCPECGVHFQGEAQDFVHPSQRSAGRGGAPVWVVVLAALVLAAIAVSALGLR